MSRTACAAILATAVAIALVGCSSTTEPGAPDPAPTQPGSASDPAPSGSLPACAEVDKAVASFIVGLHFDETVSARQTAPEAYEQRVCVFVSDDGSTQLGVTIAALPLLEEEIALYSTLPGVIYDDRTADGSAVLQLLRADDAEDGYLDSALYLFDTVHSITIQGRSDAGSLASELPGLTVAAATEAAFAVRALL